MMRQTGRTSRIVDFVVDQLFQFGQCISTDHVAYEYENLSMSGLTNFVTKVLDRVKQHTQGTKKAEYNVQKVNNIYVVHFRMVKANNDDDTIWI